MCHEILERNVLTVYYLQSPRNWVFQRDNDLKNTVVRTREWLKVKKIKGF